MAHVLIIHAVEDYDAWKRVFDEAADIRREAGERRFQVLKYEDDPNRVVHFSEWESIARAKAFSSPRVWWRSADRPGSTSPSSSTLIRSTWGCFDPADQLGRLRRQA